MKEMTLNEVENVSGGVFPVAYAALYLASVALGYNIGRDIF
jgi:lactobin A/cerein 7B family class IIb bacteriocin